MTTLKDRFDKAEKEARHAFNAAEKDIRHKVEHQVNDNDRDPAAEVNAQEAEKGTGWDRLKRATQSFKEGFNSPRADADEEEANSGSAWESFKADINKAIDKLQSEYHSCANNIRESRIGQAGHDISEAAHNVAQDLGLTGGGAPEPEEQ